MKNNCPYQDNQKRCTHKCPSVQRRSGKKIPNCLYNNPQKCPMLVDWLESLKECTTEIPTPLREEIYEGHRT